MPGKPNRHFSIESSFCQEQHEGSHISIWSSRTELSVAAAAAAAARMEHPPEYDDQSGGERTWMMTSHWKCSTSSLILFLAMFTALELMVFYGWAYRNVLLTPDVDV
jgi:hypothetical protein